MGKTQILLVEDHPMVQKMVVAILQPSNCETDVAGDGQTALVKVGGKIYDLILMDIGLPDMDGHTVTLKIREQEKNARRIPIVALTAHANEAEKAKALASGMDNFFAKPLTPQMAQQIIKQYVNRSVGIQKE